MICKNCGKEIPNNSKCNCTESKRDIVQWSNQVKLIFNIFSLSALIVAILFTAISFLLVGIPQIVVISISIILYIAFFVCNIIKSRKLKK